MSAEMTRDDWIESFVRRGLDALRDGEKDVAEEMLVSILDLIGRGPPLDEAA